MPYDDPDETDPMMLIGVELEAGDSSSLETAQVFAEEFARMGHDEESIMGLFANPFYAGAHQSFLALGEARIREIVRENTAIWGSVRLGERDSDPDSGLKLLPVLEDSRRNPNG